MSTGNIKTLYADREQTSAVFPRTKIQAISDKNGRGLEAFLDKLPYYGEEEPEDTYTTPIDAETLGGVPAEEYASKQYVKERILEVETGGSVDLSEFATKEDLKAIDYPVDSVNGKTGVVQLSASDVKAREDTWTPTASDVGARPNTWLPTPAEIGAAPVINIGNYTGDIDDVNALPVNSVGWVLTNTVNNPRASYGIIETWGSTNTIRNQRITYTDGGMCQRIRFNSKWTDWEWVNPSMSAGTAYLTTETWNGKPVYAKLINLGILPANAGLTNADVGVYNADNPTLISLDVYVTDGTFVYNVSELDDLHVYLWTNTHKWVINIEPKVNGFNRFTGKAIVKWVYN